VATIPVKGQTAAATVQRPGPGQTGLTVTSLSAAASPVNKPATSSPGSSAPSASTTAVIQNVTGQNIIKQVG
jgi:nuclear factor related to kappa-B-binding protein